MTDTRILLREYARNGSEAAFEELVRRYTDLVYSTAVRLVGGDADKAKDVAQTVFLHLARKAHRLPNQVMLGGWLHQDTCYVAATLIRSDRRRQAREREAAMRINGDRSGDDLDKVAPFLDEAISKLGNQDRLAILLRFYEQLDFRSVGQSLHSNEDSARMRVNRALDKLQIILKRQGVSISTAALATVLATQVVTAAPAAIAASLSTAVLASGATAGGVGLSILKVITMSKFKLGLISAVAFATVAVPVIVQRQAQVREENKYLRQQLGQLAPLKAEAARVSNLLAQASADASVARANLNELARLRNEVGRLRREDHEIESLRQELRERSTAAPRSSMNSENLTIGKGDQTVTARVFKLEPGVLGKLVQSSPAQEGESLPEAFQRYLQSQGIGATQKVTVVSDERTGSLIVSASQSDQMRIEKLIVDLSTAQ